MSRALVTGLANVEAYWHDVRQELDWDPGIGRNVLSRDKFPKCYEALRKRCDDSAFGPGRLLLSSILSRVQGYIHLNGQIQQSIAHRIAITDEHEQCKAREPTKYTCTRAMHRDGYIEYVDQRVYSQFSLSCSARTLPGYDPDDQTRPPYACKTST